MWYRTGSTIAHDDLASAPLAEATVEPAVQGATGMSFIFCSAEFLLYKARP